MKFDIRVTDNCQNLDESAGIICVKCNKCGRFDAEKQIEEMAKDICRSEILCHTCGESTYTYCAEAISKHLYNAGCRKQSEGEWEKRVFIIFDTEKVGYRCSSCNTTWDTPTAYCPHCGAKMKGGGE